MKRNIVFFILGLYSALVFAGVPKWITDVEKIFPSEDFIRAGGEGESEGAAKKAALAELSSYFGQTIKTEISAVQNTRQSNDVYKEKFDFVQNLMTSSEVDLFCVHYTQAWFNKKTGKYYVCAYIECDEMWQILEQKMDVLSAEFDSVMQNSKSEKESFKKLLILEEAKGISEEYEKLYQMSLAVYPKKCRQYEAVLESSLNDLLELLVLKNQIVVSVQVYGDRQNKIRTKVCEVLGQEGITTCEAPNGKTNYSLTATVIWNDSQLNSVYSSKPQLELTINGPQGVVFSYSGICEKVASYNLQTTENLAFLQLEKLLEEMGSLRLSKGHTRSH